MCSNTLTLMWWSRMGLIYLPPLALTPPSREGIKQSLKWIFWPGFYVLRFLNYHSSFSLEYYSLAFSAPPIRGGLRVIPSLCKMPYNSLFGWSFLITQHFSQLYGPEGQARSEIEGVLSPPISVHPSLSPWCNLGDDTVCVT